MISHVTVFKNRVMTTGEVGNIMMINLTDSKEGEKERKRKKIGTLMRRG